MLRLRITNPAKRTNERPLLIDAHSHINFSAYKDDAEAVIRRAEEENIWMLTVGSQIDTSRRAIECAERYPHIWAVVGLHPIHLIETTVDDEESGERIQFRTRRETFDPAAYRVLAAHPKVVAIGECGLDYYRGEGETRGLQEAAFRQQIALAQELNLPLMVHVRDNVRIANQDESVNLTNRANAAGAHEETLRILEDTHSGWRLEPPLGMIHCYSGMWEQAQRYIDLGFNIGFTGIITFTPRQSQLLIAQELQQIVRSVPLDRFLVETDCPYLAPEPHRGERNEPRYVRYIAEKIAELRGVPFGEIAQASVNNTLRLFRRTTI